MTLRQQCQACLDMIREEAILESALRYLLLLTDEQEEIDDTELEPTQPEGESK